MSRGTCTWLYDLILTLPKGMRKPTAARFRTG